MEIRRETEGVAAGKGGSEEARGDVLSYHA